MLTNDQIKKVNQHYVLQPWSKQAKRNPKIITDSEGIYFWDENNKKFYDMNAQLVYANLGHKHPKIIEAFNQFKELEISAPGFASESKAKLAQKIVDLAPNNMAKVYFTTAGAEANEQALKMAKAITGGYKIFSRYRSYHGSTLGAGNLTGESRRLGSEPSPPGFVKFDMPYLYREYQNFEDEKALSTQYLTRLERQITSEGPDTIAALVIETIPGSNGVLLPPDGYIKGIEKICRRYNIMMICDEVMSGFGRSGEWFACDHYDVQPDMITFAKGVTGGYLPLGGVILSKELSTYYDDNVFLSGATYSGHTLVCEIGNAAIKSYEDMDLIKHVKQMEIVMNERLEKLRVYKYVGDVRNKGLFGAVELVKNKQTKEPLIEYGTAQGNDKQGYMRAFSQLLLDEGFYTFAHESHVLVTPPLTITAVEINAAMDLFENALVRFEEQFPKMNEGYPAHL